jgi:DNA-binding CsgD family transcriptional regulator
MTTRLTDDDLHAMVETVNVSLDDLPPAGFPLPLLVSLCELISCDVVSAGVIDTSRTLEVWEQEVPASDVDVDVELFYQHYWDSESCSYPDRTGDTTSVIKISDFYTQREYHATGMYIDYLGPAGVERELIVTLPLGPQQSVRVLFARGDGSDFTERDRAVLTLLRPHLADILRGADDVRRGVPELTPRQWELLRLVAGGYTNAQIARRLYVSEATVRKHLENIFQRLDVNNRFAAVACAFPDRKLA